MNIQPSNLPNHSRIESMDIEAESQVHLAWGVNKSNTLQKGSSDYSLIHHLKNSILSLRQDYFSTSTVDASLLFKSKDDLDRRLLLI